MCVLFNDTKNVVFFALCNKEFQRHIIMYVEFKYLFTCNDTVHSTAYIYSYQKPGKLYKYTEKSINLLDRLYLLTIVSPSLLSTLSLTRVCAIDHFAFLVWRVTVNITLLYMGILVIYLIFQWSTRTNQFLMGK